MAYLRLGNIEFTGVFSPDSIRRTLAAKYADVQLATGKPRLQRVGTELEEVSLSLKLNRQFCDVDATLANILDLFERGEILPFQSGTGVLLGNFVLTAVQEARTQFDTSGALVEALLDITLKEWYDPNEAATEEAKASDAAFANDRRKVSPVRPQTVPTLRPSQVVSTSARSSQAQVTAATVQIKKAQAAPADQVSLMRRAKEYVETAQTRVQTVIDTLQGNIALANMAPDMAAAAQAAISAIPGLISVIASGDAGNAFSGATALGDLLKTMTRKGINIENAIAQRKI